jgi:hypothetical protein
VLVLVLVRLLRLLLPLSLHRWRPLLWLLASLPPS